MKTISTMKMRRKPNRNFAIATAARNASAIAAVTTTATIVRLVSTELQNPCWQMTRLWPFVEPSLQFTDCVQLKIAGWYGNHCGGNLRMSPGRLKDDDSIQ